MARNISLAVGRHVPFSFPKNLLGSERTTLSIYRSPFNLRDVFAAVKETISVIAAAGRVGSAVEAHRAPNPKDLKTAGLEGETFRF